MGEPERLLPGDDRHAGFEARNGPTRHGCDHLLLQRLDVFEAESRRHLRQRPAVADRRGHAVNYLTHG